MSLAEWLSDRLLLAGRDALRGGGGGMVQADPLSIFVSTTPFGAHDPEPVAWLASTGWNVRVNNTGRKLSPSEVADMARDCDGIIAGTEDLNPLLDANHRLKVISRVGVGLDSVPLQRCRARNIAVSYTPSAVTAAVAEFTIGMMLSICRQIASVDRGLRAGRWRRAQGSRIGASRVGIVGFGRIGSAVGRLLVGFDPAEVLVRDILDKRAEIAELAACGLRLREAGFEEIMTECDIVTLHVPLKPSTRGMIGPRELRLMRRDAFLINAARGGIIDETALLDVLRVGHLGGAALDVFEGEPYVGPLRELDNVLLTAHMGSCSLDCRAQMERDATADMIRYFEKRPLENPVPDDEYDNQT